MMNCHDNGSKKFAYIKLIVCVRVIVSRFNGCKIDLDNISVNSGNKTKTIKQSNKTLKISKIQYFQPLTYSTLSFIVIEK